MLNFMAIKIVRGRMKMTNYDDKVAAVVVTALSLTKRARSAASYPINSLRLHTNL